MKTKLNMPTLLTLLVVASPILDVLTSMAAHFGIPVTIGTIVRTAIMLVAIVYVLKSSRRTPALLAVTVAFAGYGMLFFANLYRLGGIALCVSNVQTTAKTFFTPVIALCLYALWRDRKFVISTKAIAIAGSAYTMIILVAYLTGTSFTSYADSGYGNCGWFYAANEIGCIVAITAPIVFYYILGALPFNQPRRDTATMAAAAISIVFAANFIGTKVVYGLTLLYACLAAAWFVLRQRKTGLKEDRSRASFMLAIAGMIVVFYAVSPLARYLSDVYLELFRPDSPLRAISEGAEVNIAAQGSTLKNLLENHPMLDKLDQILSRRLLVASSSVQVWLDSTWAEKLLGIGYVTAPDYGRNVSFMIEMDFLAILVRHGILGFAMYACPYIAFMVNACIRFVKDAKTCWTSFRHCTYLYSSLAGFAIAFVAGHALVSPAVAMFVLAVTAGLYAQMERPVPDFQDVSVRTVDFRLPDPGKQIKNDRRTAA